jgi:hypothetical protein
MSVAAFAMLWCLCGGTATAGPATPASGAHRLIDVPYLPQTPELCGGAAVAMVLRYWGDRTVLPMDFQSLVRASAGGIQTSDLVRAVTSRGWQTHANQGSSGAPLEELRHEIDQGRPVVALLEVSPKRFHYVVVVGMTQDSVVLHDPARTSFLVAAADEFDREWRGSDRWRLVVLPPPTSRAIGEAAPRASAASAVPQTRTGACGALVDRGVGLADTDSNAAERALRAASELCPASADPWLERAGLRFRAADWPAAEQLARHAANLDPSNEDAWALVATSQYMNDQPAAALDAWNQIGEPTIDTVTLTGARKTPQPALVRLMGLVPRTLLTRATFVRASRRLVDAPTVDTARLKYEPQSSGSADVTAAIAEHNAFPHAPAELLVVGGRAIFANQLDVTMAGLAGQGETIRTMWRWPTARPMFGVTLSVPSPAPLPGISHLELLWDTQSYALPQPDGGAIVARDDRGRAVFDLDTWAMSNTRLEGGAGLDRFASNDYLAAHAAIEQHVAGDRVIARAQVEHWSLGRGASFSTRDLTLSWRSTTDVTKPALFAVVGDSAASIEAPRALWMGAGTGDGRPVLLRAHPLLDDDVIAGPNFGRHVVFSTSEYQHPVRQIFTGAIDVAAFVDAVRVSDGLAGPNASTWQVDAGAGLRFRLPQAGGSARLDFARGLRDGRMAISVGWTTSDSNANRRIRR